ncbi:MAG: hypothetical protein JXB15_13090 [Anaerolineales bacterium]|nr:hypothetical protein [Anaerolineales bacterium]
MPRIRFGPRLVPLALLLLCLLSFGALIARLGFYWDDWPSVWLYHFFGPESFHTGFSEDRPLLAWVFILTTSLVGESMPGWQLLGILARWLTGLSFWWMLRQLWPRHTMQITWAALLFVVYPGFRQQYISVTYSNALLVYALYLTSIAAMIQAQRKPGWYWPLMLFSIAAAAISLFISEYFFGLEFLRPLILWLVQNKPGQGWRSRLGKIALQWAPYLAVVVLFVYWRLFLHTNPRGSIVIFQYLSENPLQTILYHLKTISWDLLEINLLAWIKTTNVLGLLDFSPFYILLYIFIVISSAFVVIYFLAHFEAKNGAEDATNPPETARSWGWQAVVVGLWAVLVAGLPVWVTDLHIELIFPWDRFTLPMMVGASILLAGLLSLLNRPARQNAVILAILISLSAGMHFHDALMYRKEWLAQKDFLWQLAWRVPGLKEGTTLLTAELPFTYYSDNSLTAPLNWTYSPDHVSAKMPYMLYDIESRLGKWLTAIEPDVSIDQPYRAASFNGTTSQAVVFFYAPPRCLKVMHPVLDRNLPYKPIYIPEALPLSKPDLILTEVADPARPPEAILGEEPAPDWCTYFEKAELASQAEDWEQVVSLGEKAFALGKKFDRETASELVPFILGYAHAGQWDKAVKLSLQAYEASPKMENMLCTSWLWLKQTTAQDAQRADAFEQIEAILACQLK